MTQNELMGNYQKVQIETSRKEKLVSMLLEGAIRFLMLARNKENDIWAYRLNVLKAESIILELIGSLNFEKGGEIAVSLHKLYIYILDTLSGLLEERRNEKLEEVMNLLIPLKDTWNEATRKYMEENSAAAKKLSTAAIRA